MDLTSAHPPTATIPGIMPNTILEPGQIEFSAGAIEPFRLPGRGLFATRARRLRTLAQGHGLGEILHFAAALAERQGTAWGDLAPPALPSPDLLARCREVAMPPLAPPAWWPGAAWLDLARRLAEDLAPLLPAGGAGIGPRIAQANDDWLDSQARGLLAAEPEGLDLAAVPFVGAALQVHWTAAAAALAPQDLGHPPERPQCPVCGSAPVASVLRIDGSAAGLRYLHCGLCATEWHVVRTKCALCDNSRGLKYLSVEGQGDAVQAEACPECRGYL
jgi:FdhE protein